MITVAISTIHEEEYVIKNNKKGEELLKLIQKEVEITGEIKEDETGKTIVVVQNYKVIPP